MARPRSVCFTLNNPTELEISNLNNFLETVNYAIYQRERGSNGTEHLQGYICLGKPTTFTKWKTICGRRAHIEAARGTAEENKAYCSKEDTRIAPPVEFGVLPSPGRRSDLAGIIAAARDVTIKMADVLETDAESYLRYHRGIHAIRSLSFGRRDWKTEIFWFWGPTGTGKSREAYARAPNAYWKAGGTKWWDGYDGHEDVIIDDYRKDLCPFHELLRLFDRYPMMVEMKGSSISFIPKRIFVTTPKNPNDTWEGRTEEDIQQLVRRIENIVHFDSL